MCFPENLADTVQPERSSVTTSFTRTVNWPCRVSLIVRIWQVQVQNVFAVIRKPRLPKLSVLMMYISPKEWRKTDQWRYQALHSFTFVTIHKVTCGSFYSGVNSVWGVKRVDHAFNIRRTWDSVRTTTTTSHFQKHFLGVFQWMIRYVVVEAPEVLFLM